MGVFDSVGDEDHEQIVFGNDPASGLRCIIAIHSTTLGPALGGTRFHAYDSEDDALRDALRLSHGMTYKAAAAGLDLGGGKAVIIGDPDELRSERLLRAYGRLVDSLGGRYVTAEDVGTTTSDMEMISRETRWAFGRPRASGGGGDPSPATARGVLSAMHAVTRRLWGGVDMAGRRVAIQGVGKVGSSLATRLLAEKAEVVVADPDDDAVDAMQAAGAKVVGLDAILTTDCDILAPCALGGVLNEDSIPRLACAAVVGSANNQLATDEDDNLLADHGIVYTPDFVVNAGGLINVADELHGYDEERVMHRVDSIGTATSQILDAAQRMGVTPNEAAIALAEERIRTIGDLRRSRRVGEPVR